MSIHSLLILGHSGAGKSPLGDALCHTMSTDQERWFHFDFGQNLRDITAQNHCSFLTLSELKILQTFMTGTLIDSSNFSIANKIIEHFLDMNRFNSRNDHLVLNGFPRNLEQAAFIDSLPITIDHVLYLQCSAEVAWQRKELAEKGRGFEDRSIRNDTASAIFQKKINSFEIETSPLLEWYKAKSIIIPIEIWVETSPHDVIKSIFKHLRQT